MKKPSAKYKAVLGSRRKSLWFSLITSMLLLLVCYFTDNIGYSILSGPSVGQRIEQFREFLGIAEDKVPEDYVFINIAYDRELVSVYDEYDLPKGEIDITNREKLNQFISEASGYRYMMVDVLLSDAYRSENDSLLIKTIENKKNIAIARSETSDLISYGLLPKAGYTDYSTDILETNFVKYEFSRHREPTMPLKAYREITGKDGYKSFGPFHFHNRRLSWKSLVLRFPTKLWNESVDGSDMLKEKILLNLGSDILDTGMDINGLVKDKIVVIGDFTEDDIHDTYIGKIAGPIINMNALEALLRNELEIPWTLVLFLFVVYTVIIYCIIRNVTVINSLFKRIKNAILRYLLSFVGISFSLSIMAAIIYLSCGCDINILIPSLWFTFLGGITKTVSKL